jgi:hypothetical protein
VVVEHLAFMAVEIKIHQGNEQAASLYQAK